MIEFKKYFFLTSLFLQLFTFNTASIIKDRVPSDNLENDSIKTVLQTLVPIIQLHGPDFGLHICDGVLIHPRAVFASRACIRNYLPHSYAVSIYKWKNSRASINRTQLHRVQYFLNSYVYFGFLKQDKSLLNIQSENYEYINMKTPVLLVLKEPINSMVPATFTHSMTSQDMHNKQKSKECYRLEIAPNFSQTNSSIESAILYKVIPDGKILTPSEIKTIYYASVHQKFVDDIKNNGNISLLYVSYDSIFVTSSQKIVDNTISRSSGSPLVCRRHPQDPFQLTGILIDTLDNFPAYFAINEIWTKQKLVFLNSLKQYIYKITLLLSLTMFWDFPASAGTLIESVTTLIIKEPVVAPLIIDWLVPILHIGNLQNHYLYFCSGVLIHSRVVLSAGKAFDE
ncbi:Protein of unknown function [Cotesia congregata]|uniref:Peptidase S1 domain-containing protein n=1 Tax=Cotesia congregata TaxID=51543 RepID=A0A8J2MU10_COTCN|nr:Protein of unknown function [Cotesia congregata]